MAGAQQTLRRNGLRVRVRLQTDGGLKTGLDVIKAAMLGAESFGFGTGPMVALGCKYLRICHLNNCATGIATQNETLRQEHFLGLPEMVMNYFRFVAADVREHLARLGVRSVAELIGRSDLLQQGEGCTPVHQQLDLSRLIANDGLGAAVDSACALPRNPVRDEATLAGCIARDAAPLVELGSGGTAISNTDRAIGARLCDEVARRWGDHGMPEPITVQLEGSAGQSLGAWNVGGGDGDGRARLRHVEGNETELRADVVIQAFGFRPSPPAWCAVHAIKLDASGCMLAGGDGRLPFQTGHAKVFTGGDSMRGADLVVRAVHDGRETAKSIAQMFSALPMAEVTCVA